MEYSVITSVGQGKTLSPWRKSNLEPSVNRSDALTTEQVDTTSLAASLRISVGRASDRCPGGHEFDSWPRFFSLSHAYDKLNIPSFHLSYFFPNLKFTIFLSVCKISFWRGKGYYLTCHWIHSVSLNFESVCLMYRQLGFMEIFIQTISCGTINVWRALLKNYKWPLSNFKNLHIYTNINLIFFQVYIIKKLPLFTWSRTPSNFLISNFVSLFCDFYLNGKLLEHFMSVFLSEI